VDKSTKGDWYK